MAPAGTTMCFIPLPHRPASTGVVAWTSADLISCAAVTASGWSGVVLVVPAGVVVRAAAAGGALLVRFTSPASETFAVSTECTLPLASSAMRDAPTCSVALPSSARPPLMLVNVPLTSMLVASISRGFLSAPSVTWAP